MAYSGGLMPPPTESSWAAACIRFYASCNIISIHAQSASAESSCAAESSRAATAGANPLESALSTRACVGRQGQERQGLEMIIAACCVSAVMDFGYLCGDELWIHLRRRRRLRELSSADSAEYGRSYGIRLELLLKAAVCCRLRRNPSGCGIHPLVRIDNSLHAQSASCCLRAPGLLAPPRSSQRIILRSINTHSQIAHAEACGSCASEPRSGAQARHARLWVDFGQGARAKWTRLLLVMLMCAQ